MRACGLCGAPAGRRLHEGVGPGDLGAAPGRGRGGSGVEGVGLGEVDDEGAAGALVEVVELDEAALEVDDGEARRAPGDVGVSPDDGEVAAADDEATTNPVAVPLPLSGVSDVSVANFVDRSLREHSRPHPLPPRRR